jgi:penicillin-binding protein 2
MTFVHDRRHLPARLAVLRVAVVVVFAVLAACFWYFQVVQHQHFRELAQNNHLRTLALRAPRGTLLDRDGRVLVV